MRNPKLLPLALLYANDAEAVEGITRMQKLVFLAQENSNQLDEYNFRPDSYGPFSVGLYDDLDQMVEEGYIQCDKTSTSNGNRKDVYSLTPKGREYLEEVLYDYGLIDQVPLEELTQLKSEINDMPLLKLLKGLYSEYPEMAENSELNLV